MTEATRAARPPRYTAVAITLHWLIALMIAGLIAVGWYMGDLPDGAPGQQQLYQMHKSFGIMVLVLTLARIGWRVLNPPPPLPADMPAREKLASHAVHIGFYGLMLAMPLTGWLYVSTAYDFDVPTVLFGAISWPDIPGVGFLANPAGHGVVEFIHSKLAWLAIALIVLHVAGAVKHEFADEEGVFKRMVPWIFGDTGGPAAPPRGAVLCFGGALAVFAAIAAVPLLTQPGAATVPDAPPSAASNWTVDPDASAITFSGVHDGNRYEGRFERWQADITFDADALDAASATVRVETASAVTGTKLYDDSLKAAEWLDPRSFPVATVTLDDFRRSEEGGYVAEATLTLKDQSVSVPFRFDLALDGDTAEMTGSTSLSRSALDIGMKSDPGADYVADAVSIEVRVTATRQP